MFSRDIPVYVLHCFLSSFFTLDTGFLLTFDKVFFFHIFIIIWYIICFNVRSAFFINSGNISSGQAALLGFKFLIISFNSSFVGSSRSELFIGSSCLSKLFMLSVSGFNNCLNYFCHPSNVRFFNIMFPSLSLHTNVVRSGRLYKFLIYL